MASAVAPVFEVTPPVSQFEITPPKKYLPGRQFGMDVAKGMGLDAEAIKKAEDTWGQTEGLKEIGRQVLEGLTHFVSSVAKDPFNAVQPITGAATNFETAVKSGSPGQIMGAVSTILGGAQTASKAGEVAGIARGAVGEAIHEGGELTSGAKLTGKIVGGSVGAGVGSAIGHEYLGAATGYKLGPALLDKLFPESEATATAREEAASYMKKAEDLMRRGKEQATLDRQAAIQAAKTARETVKTAREAAKNVSEPSPFSGATSTAAPIGNLKLPEPGVSAASASGTLPQGSSTPFVGKFTAPETAKIVSPLSPPPPINRTLVSYDRNLLVHMARGGDLNALRELIRNPGDIDVASAVPNSKYLMEGGAPTSIYGGPGSVK